MVLIRFIIYTLRSPITVETFDQGCDPQDMNGVITRCWAKVEMAGLTDKIAASGVAKCPNEELVDVFIITYLPVGRLPTPALFVCHNRGGSSRLQASHLHAVVG